MSLLSFIYDLLLLNLLHFIIIFFPKFFIYINNSFLYEPENLSYILIIGPLIETFYFQFFIIEILAKITSKKYIYIIISTLSFSLFHNSNLLFSLIITLPAALLFALSYVIIRESSILHALVIVSVIHSLNNIYIIIIFILHKWIYFLIW